MENENKTQVSYIWRKGGKRTLKQNPQRISSADMDPREEVGLVYKGNDIVGLGSDNDLMLTR